MITIAALTLLAVAPAEAPTCELTDNACKAQQFIDKSRTAPPGARALYLYTAHRSYLALFAQSGKVQDLCAARASFDRSVGVQGQSEGQRASFEAARAELEALEQQFGARCGVTAKRRKRVDATPVAARTPAAGEGPIEGDVVGLEPRRRRHVQIDGAGDLLPAALIVAVDRGPASVHETGVLGARREVADAHRGRLTRAREGHAHDAAPVVPGRRPRVLRGEAAAVEHGLEVGDHLRAAAHHDAIMLGLEFRHAGVLEQLACFDQFRDAALVPERLARDGGVIDQLVAHDGVLVGADNQGLGAIGGDPESRVIGVPLGGLGDGAGLEGARFRRGFAGSGGTADDTGQEQDQRENAWEDFHGQ